MDVILDRDAEGGLVAKIQSDEWEVDVWASDDDFMKLKDIRSADWKERRSIRVGESAGAPTFWPVPTVS